MNKKLRFEVFKRDLFTCKYCGKKPGETVLEVDHIIPRYKKGTDEIENLITSCFDCNRGKGKRMLNELTPEMQKNADILKEKKEQLQAFYKYQKEISKVTDKPVTILANYWSELTENEYSLSTKGKISLKYFLKSFTIQEIKDAMEISTKIDDVNQRFKYFCGIMHNKKRAKDDPDFFEIVRYWKSKQKGSGYYKNEGLEVLVKGKEEMGHQPHSTEESKEVIDVIFSKPRKSFYATLIDYLNDEEYINDEMSEYWEKKQKNIERTEWHELQRKNELTNPLLFKALNHYASLMNGYFIPTLVSKEINTIIQKHGLDDAMRMIEYSIVSDYFSEAAIYKLAAEEQEIMGKYKKWLKKGYKNFIALIKEAIYDTEDKNVDHVIRELLILSVNFPQKTAEGILNYVMAVKGDLRPEYFSDLKTLYTEYLEEEKSISDFLNEGK